MKKIFIYFVILFFLTPVHASVMLTPASALPDFVLFNFQISQADQQSLTNILDPAVGNSAFESNGVVINGPDYAITASIPVAAGAVPHSWLDGPNGGLIGGGLGVCEVSDCGELPSGPNPDAPINIGETVELTYEGVERIFVGHIFFQNADHESGMNAFAPGAKFGISINNGLAMFYDLVSEFDLLKDLQINPGGTIQFFWGDENSQNGQDYFVAGWGVVPIPAALPLFLSGLFGFAFFSRKKTKEATA